MKNLCGMYDVRATRDHVSCNLINGCMKLAIDTYMMAGSRAAESRVEKPPRVKACVIDRSNCIFSSATFMRVDVQIIKVT